MVWHRLNHVAAIESSFLLPEQMLLLHDFLRVDAQIMNDDALRHSLLLSTALGALLCFCTTDAVAHPQVLGGGSDAGAWAFEQDFGSDIGMGYTGTGPNYTYCAVGGGTGHSAFLDNAFTQLNTAPNTCYPNYAPVSGDFDVDYGVSAAVLASTDVANFHSTYLQPLIQIAVMGMPVVLPFNLTDQGVSSDGALALTDSDLCRIFSGKITDWSKITSHAGLSGTIEVAYRSDGSGTTFLLTDRLKIVCNGIGFTGAQRALMPTTSFASLFGGTNPPLPNSFWAEPGAAYVENFIVGRANAFGYVSPDYTHISTHGQQIGGPFVAALNGELPTTTNTKDALESWGRSVGSSYNGYGLVPPPASNPYYGDPSDATEWVPLVPHPYQGYPIVGWVTWDLATCYYFTATANNIIGFFNDFFNAHGLANDKLFKPITDSGFVPVTDVKGGAPYRSAIINDFLTNNSGYNLNINNPNTCSGTYLRY
jgi:phosphate transport system substrate-binding protein